MQQFPIPPNLTPTSQPTPPPTARMRPFFRRALAVIGVLMVVALIAGVVAKRHDQAELRAKGFVDTGLTTTYDGCIADGGHLENNVCVGAVHLLVPGDCGLEHGRRILPASCEMGDYTVVGIALVTSNPKKVCPAGTKWTTKSTKQLVCWAPKA